MVDKITVVDEEAEDALFAQHEMAILRGASDEELNIIEAQIELLQGATVH